MSDQRLKGDQNGKDWGPLLSESPQTVKDEGQLAPQSSGTVEKTHETTSREVTKGDGVPYDRGWAWMIVLGEMRIYSQVYTHRKVEDTLFHNESMCT